MEVLKMDGKIGASFARFEHLLGADESQDWWSDRAEMS
jgi:hypothetical protein